MDFKVSLNNKKVDLATCSMLSLEVVELLDQLTEDGRANLLDFKPDAGGMCVHANRGIRWFDDRAKLGICSLVGELDEDAAHAAVAKLDLRARMLFSVPGKRTNRSRVSLAPHDKKQIVRLERAISLENDLTPQMLRAACNQLASSRSCLIGNMDPDLAGEFIESARAAGTYTGLCAGARQFGELKRLRPHALFLNLQEARQAVSANGEPPEKIFQRLLKETAAEQVVVMTAGAGPVHLADLRSGTRWELQPPRLPQPENQFEMPNALGCGDTLSGTTTFLLGHCQDSFDADHVHEAVRFAQHVVAVHMTENAQARAELRQYYQDIAPKFQIPAEHYVSGVQNRLAPNRR